MENKINVAEILQDRIGMKVYSPLFGVCIVKDVDMKLQYPIILREESKGNNVTFTEFGFYHYGYENSECLLFPSKEQRDWSELIPKPIELNVSRINPQEITIAVGYRNMISISIEDGYLKGCGIGELDSSELFEPIEF